MLLEISIRDLAIFANAQAEFASGLNVLTGETGAGKTVFLSALRLLQGGRAEADLVRRGAEKALVQARFRPTPDPRLDARLQEIGADLEDGELLLTREVSAQGRSRVRIGSVNASLKDLQALSRLLFDLHGQHAEQRLFNEDNHAGILVSLGGADQALADYRTVFQEWKRLESEAEEAQARGESAARDREYLEFQLRDLDEIKPVAGEEVELETRLGILSQAGKISEDLIRIRQALSSEAVEKALSQAARLAGKHAAIHAGLAQVVASVEQAREALVQAAADADALDVPEEADPAEIDRLNARLARLQRLCARHRTDVSGLVALRESMRQRLDEADEGPQLVARLRGRARQTLDKVKSLGAKLETLQRDSATRLDAEVTERLQGLGMTGAALRTRFQTLDQPGRDGLVKAVFELCPNPGEGWRDLAEVASGGEASRIMLAIESCLAGVDPVGLLVFDEVDAGLSGTVAHSVGDSLRQLAQGRQIISITHLHQVAAAADRHLAMAKRTIEGRTYSEVDALGHEERIEELCRMLGRPDDPAVRVHASSLLRERGT
ncbi:MAG: DNA repair protein RecN [Fibrobacteria bacterium]|nr:DNA repair protein RecN [Fibrobacteria bacterium]